MRKGRKTVLVSKKTGKEYRFESAQQADLFLGHCRNYISLAHANGLRIFHNETREEFDVYFLEKPKKLYCRSAQLCWECKKSINGCSWSRKGIPVKGWEAVPVQLKQAKIVIDTYKITGCPEFEAD